MAAAEPKGGRDRRRIIIEGVQPAIDCGRFPCKRVVGQDLIVDGGSVLPSHQSDELLKTLLDRWS